MYRVYIVMGVLATVLYGWGQYHGYSLFADGSEREARGATGGYRRAYHK